MEELLDGLGGLQVLSVENTASVQGVLDALVKATSQNPELLKVAENQLTKWGTEPGFYSILLNIAFDQNIDLNVRWLAILCSKNGIDKYWENFSVITDDERCAIRHKLLSSLFEPNNQIALQLTVLIAKVAYYDLSKWQELVPTLINGIQSTEEFHHLRSLLTLCHIVKVIAPVSKGDLIIYFLTKRRSEVFDQFAHAFFPTILNQWINSSTSFIDTLQTDVVKASPLLESAFLCLKMLKRLVFGFEDISEQPSVLKFLDLIFKQFKPFLESRLALMNMEHTRQTCEKYLVLLVKVLISVKRFKRSEFVPFIQPTLECGVTYCFNNDFQNYTFEAFITRFMNLLTAVSEKESLSPRCSLSRNYFETMCIIKEKNKPIDSFFSHSVLNEIFQQLLSKYLPLTEEELCCWKNDPEEFAIQDHFLWIFPDNKGPEIGKGISLRLAAVNFFIQLSKSFQDTMSTLVFEAIDAIGINNVNSAIDVLKKEAVYLVAGLASFDLFSYTKYSKLFPNVILPELKNKSNDHCIIRRRVAWLMGFCCVKLKRSLADSLHDALMPCMVKEEDLVVRLTAVHSLRCILKECSIDREVFLPLVKDTFSLLFQLMLDVEELELKLLVLSTLNYVLELRLEHMNLYLTDLVDYLPRLWNQCRNHSLLQCAIINSFKHLVQCFRKDSERLHPMLLPMITFCIDLTQPFHVYLLDDGLRLWYSVLENALTCSADLMDVGTNLMSMLECNNENFEICLKIVEAYILLAPAEFLERYGQDFAKTSTSLLRNLEPEKIKKLLTVVEIIFLLCPEGGPVHFQPLLLIVLDLALRDIKDRSVSHPITLSLLSYVILNNKTVFVSILQEKAAEAEKNANIILGELLAVWLLHISPHTSYHHNKKIMAFALSCLLTSGFEIVYDRFAGILYGIVNVLDCLSENGDSLTDDCMIKFAPEELMQEIAYRDSYFLSYHRTRQQELDKRNPVFYVKLRDYFHEQMKALVQSVGTSKFEELMATVEIKAREQITKYLQA